MLEKEPKNKKEKNKISFIKKVLISIKDFDKYETFGLEKISQTLLYLIQIIIIFTLIVTLIAIFKFANTLNIATEYFYDQIYDLKYENTILSINNNNKIELEELENSIGKIVIDTSELSNEQIEEYKEDIQNQSNGIIFLKDKILIKNEMLSTINENSYKDFITQETLNKEDIINYINNNKIVIYVSVSVVIFIYMFAIYLASVLVDSIVLGTLGFLTARIAKMRIRYGATFNMAVHALTLPIILNILYIIINALTGFVITYFQVMYTAISYIYMITAILIIKSDYIKRQADLNKIQSKQEEIKKELEEKEEEEKAKKEKEKAKKERKDKEEKESKTTKPKIGDKPEGDNA